MYSQKPCKASMTDLWVKTRHVDNVSWSDQLDVLSAVSKAGCASTGAPENSKNVH